MKTLNASEIFFNTRRFDLIFKYLYLKNHERFGAQTSFFEDLYCEHIRAFNSFHENNPSDGIPKDGREAFLAAFSRIYRDIKDNGFDANKSIAPLAKHYELKDASHRLAACFLLNKDIAVSTAESSGYYYDYKFFQSRSIDVDMADYAALEYVKINPNAYIVNLHSVTPDKYDHKVEAILKKYGFIFYQKDIYLNFNGYVNVKKLSYSFHVGATPPWIGTVDNQFRGAQSHAKQSIGASPLRAYVFVCDDLNKVVAAKEEIRCIYNIGNYSVHINDTRKEAIWLAQTYFNANSLHLINTRPFWYECPEFDMLVTELQEETDRQHVDIDDICACGSTPLAIFGARASRDMDYLCCSEKTFEKRNPYISSHDSELKYYPLNKVEIIKNPKNHFYYKGVKFISLDVLYEMKKKRNEVPKDVCDCELIQELKKGTLKLGLKKFRRKFKLIKVEKEGVRRRVTILGFIRFSYKKKVAE